jgi:hypothetical protein
MQGVVLCRAVLFMIVKQSVYENQGVEEGAKWPF